MKYEIIVELVHEKFVSLDTPQYFFVNQALKERPYSTFVNKLRESWTVEEVTEPNTDVSFRYELTDGVFTFILILSIVGKLAIVMRHENGKNLLVEVPGETQTEKNYWQIFWVLALRYLINKRSKPLLK